MQQSGRRKKKGQKRKTEDKNNKMNAHLHSKLGWKKTHINYAKVPKDLIYTVPEYRQNVHFFAE